MATEFTDDLAGGSPPKAAVLLIIGEPFSEDDKQLILEEIVKGFKGWDSEATGVDINDELAQIANRASLGEEGPNGERIIRHRSDNSAVELLINPQSQTVKESLKAVLAQLSPTKLVLYAGYAFQGTAAWVVQDDLFTFSTFNQVFKDPNVENALKQIEGASLTLQTTSPNDWTAALKGSDVERLLKVTVNPKPHIEHVHGVVQFTAYVGNLVRAIPLGSMLQASDVIGNISFSRPVLYIFPGHHGDAALFGMKGFNMLVNGGYSRHSCFWDFVRHLDGIDALLLTHLGPDNLFGIKALLERKATDSIHPDIGFMYMNTGKGSNGTKAIEGESSPDLVINLSVEGNRLLELSRKLGHAPHPLTRPLSGNLEPIKLFHKVGKGSLDMYVLNPVGDAKEMKDFLSQWDKQASTFSQANGIPIPNCTSVCALLVVRPANPAENITRILFPGTAPQHKLLEGLERVKHLEFLKYPYACAQDLQKPKKAPAAAAAGRPSSGARKPPSTAPSRPASSTKSDTSTGASRSAAKPEPPKRLETKSSATKVAAASAASKSAKSLKENNNKRASSAKDKEKVKLDEKEKEDKSKSSSSSSPSKASVKTASPVKTPSSPPRTPADAVQSQPPAAVASPSLPDQPPAPEPAPQEQPPAPEPAPQEKPPSPEPAPQEQPPAPEPQPPAPEPTPQEQPPAEANHMDQDLGSAEPMREAPPANAELLQCSNAVDSTPLEAAAPPAALTEQQKLHELGIYDDDDDEGVDDGFDDRENEAGFGAQPQSLPEPTAAVETPPCAEPDLIQDTLCQPSAMVQSQLFEQEIEPDYSAEDKAAPAGYGLETEPAEHDSASPEPEQEHLKEQSPVSDIKEYSPMPEEQSYSDKEPSPDLQEKDTCLQEPSFADDPVESHGSNNISQKIQYGMPHDNGYQMGGIREEEEEDLERDSHGQMGQAEINKQSMEEMGIYDDDDDEGQDDDEEAPEADDSGDYEKDAYAYENDGNLEDEEIRRVDQSGQMADEHAEGRSHGFAEQDLQGSNIPEAFERDESPTPMEKFPEAEQGGEVDSGQEDTDSIDGGTPDHDKDIDEALAVQQQKQDPLEDLMTGHDPGLGDGQQFNPFIGLGAQNAGMASGVDDLAEKQASPFEQDELNDVQQRGGAVEFDPLAQWGPPTGLPAPSPLEDDLGLEQEQDAADVQKTVKDTHHSLLQGEAELEQEEDSCKDDLEEPDLTAHGFGLEAVGNALTVHSDKGSEADPSEFDPLAEWGHPMGLPSPPPPEPSGKSTPSKSGAGDVKKAEAKKPGASPMRGKTGPEKRPASASTKSPAKPANGTAEPPKSGRAKPDPKRASLDASRSARPASGKSLDTSRVESKPRTGSAATARKPANATAKARASPDVVKMPTLPAFTPFYVDLTYIPNHGDVSYIDAEFFKRIRARYYILSARNPNPKVLEMLIDAKSSWDKANEQEVTVIPTYETQILQHWMAVHKEKLAESKIEIAPAASRCTVRLQDHEDSCYTYRLEF